MNSAPDTWKEARRLQAWYLKQTGWAQRQIAEAMGVSEGAVSQWMQRARQRAEAAIARWREHTWPTIKRGRKPSSRAFFS
jgi:DNA-directed RNA polymerase specialized sigma24 family protein